MNIVEEITKLTDEWYFLIGKDHHKDRDCHWYIEALYPECELVIINQTEDDKQDLMQDFISLVTSFCARIYSKRRSKRQTEKLIKKALEENP